MGVTRDDIMRITGEAMPEPEMPRTKAEDASLQLDAMNDRMSDLVERERRPGETHAAAHARILSDRPEIYTALKRAQARIVNKAGGAGAVGGV